MFSDLEPAVKGFEDLELYVGIIWMHFLTFIYRPAVLHGPADRIAAVMGMDISFKYFYKMLTDQIPICEQESIR